MLQSQELPRIFKFEINKEVIELEDPNPAFTPNDIRDLYTAQYAELLNSTIVPQGIENDRIVYEFKVVAGTKG
ncbi:PRTRC genetic system protein C [Flavobacterium chryseum]|uniref:PRTRC system protein C n=1 Tax=Flavobacterium sp. P3160 TaxID=2512113 RepID=UPI00105FF7F1|nr:PRTRC system protein C [Flavobacterium sp. P3160]TDO68771.1 PRTRC genetic system protein C [Flavobacterium sp. P3160]